MPAVAASREDVLCAIAEGRLIVNRITGHLDTRTDRTVPWHRPKYELVSGPGRKQKYVRIRFACSRGLFRVLVHRAVWWASGKMIPPGMTLDHDNGSTQDNRLTNLKIVTQRRNNESAIAAGRLVPGARKRNWLAPELVASIHASDAPRDELAARYGVSKSTISRIRSGRSHRDVTSGARPNTRTELAPLGCRSPRS